MLDLETIAIAMNIQLEWYRYRL